MASLLRSIGNRFRRTFRPTETRGAPGTAVDAGRVREIERDAKLTDRERYKTFSNMLANTSIVSAGVRYFLNLAAKPAWSFEPAEADTDSMFADLTEEILTSDPDTPWHRVVRRAAMYRFYGFSVQEWTAQRRDDGILTFKDIAPRAQRTIERWDTEEDGNVLGIIQKSPQTSRDIYLPRQKVLYIVDDSLSDSPEGLGLFRHLVDPNQRLKELERLEGEGFDMDLNGIPLARVPLQVLDELVQRELLTKEERDERVEVIKNFITNRRRNPSKGLLIDSKTYETEDEAARPSNVPMWDLDIINSSPNTIEAVAKSIERINHEMARIMGVESLLLGSDSAGSFALSKDKTNNFFLVVDSALTDVRSSVDNDLIKRIWALNGWPEEMRPRAKSENVQFRDVEQITAALRDMASAGAVIMPDDPIINEVRALLGLSPVDVDALAEDATLDDDPVDEDEELEAA